MTAPEPVGTCHHCGRALLPAEYGRQESCPGCGRDTKVCKNCVWYDRAYNNECRENQADRVVEKEKFNFCDYFKPGKPGASGGSSKDAAKSAADALFKKKT